MHYTIEISENVNIRSMERYKLERPKKDCCDVQAGQAGIIYMYHHSWVVGIIIINSPIFFWRYYDVLTCLLIPA